MRMRYPTHDDAGLRALLPSPVRHQQIENVKSDERGYTMNREGPNNPDALALLLPFLFVLSTLLFVMILFLVCVLLLRRRRGIRLRDNDGPVDVSRDDVFNDADGGIVGVEERWLESLGEDIKRNYRQAKLYEAQYPPNSLPTDITLSQFLTIQEKGVSAWSFDPEYEALTPVLVHARTELTFLPDPSSSSSVQSNLPIPKLNEVYYWEVKMFDLPSTTNVAVGLATKPYPTFRLPGWNKYSVGYHSNGDKSYNYPFTATPFGPPLREGDVLGVGYKPRTGTVFFTRNGRKTEEAFSGLSRWNLFPTVGADGPCSVHVNLGQAGFVFIEANVKKWGLAPSVGTLAPPPAYGSERGSILLEAGGANIRREGGPGTPGSSGRRSHRSRRPKPPGQGGSNSAPTNPSPLRSAPLSPPPPFSPGESTTRHGRQGILDVLGAGAGVGPSGSRSMPGASTSRLEPIPAEEEDDRASTTSSQRTARNGEGGSGGDTSDYVNGGGNSNALLRVVSGSPDDVEPESPYIVNPPTPNVSDIHLRTLDRSSIDLGRGRPGPTPSQGLSTSSHNRSGSLSLNQNASASSSQRHTHTRSGSQSQTHARTGSLSHNRTRSQQQQQPLEQELQETNVIGRGARRREESEGSSERSSVSGSEDSIETASARGVDPPGYAVINPHIYASGVHIDLPAEVIQAALDGRPIEPSASTSAAGALNPGRGVRR